MDDSLSDTAQDSSDSYIDSTSSSDVDATTESTSESTFDTTGTTTTATTTDSTDTQDTDSETATSSDTPENTVTPLDTNGDSTLPQQEVCEQWNAATNSVGEGKWTGSIATCTPGTMSESWRSDTFELGNTYRWLAGLPAIEEDRDGHAAAQSCALMMQARGELSKDVNPSWECYDAAGAATAARAGTFYGPAIDSIYSSMFDDGNQTTLSHRRWILYSGLEKMAIGSTQSFACIDSRRNSSDQFAKDLVVWPPAGYVPWESLVYGWQNISATGFSVQSSVYSLSDAIVTVRQGGSKLPVKTKILTEYAGDRWAMSILPQAWEIYPGYTYDVEISSSAFDYQYSFTPTVCSP